MRLTRKRAKPGELCMFYGRLPGDNPDTIYSWGDGCSKRDGALLNMVIGGPIWDWNGKPNKSLLDELKDRGYDITTLKFSIQKTKEPQCPTP